MGTPSVRTLTVRGGIAVVVAVICNAVLVTIATALALAPGFMPLTYGPVVAFTALGIAAATAVFAFLVRTRPEPRSVFRKLAAAALLVSFLPDFGLLVGDPAATPAGVVILMLMHVVAAAVTVWLLTR